MNIDDAIRQLGELKTLYGNLPITVHGVCAHADDAPHRRDCYDDATVELKDVANDGFTSTRTRMVVID